MGMFVHRLRKHEFNTTQIKFSAFVDQNGYRNKPMYKSHDHADSITYLGEGKCIYKDISRGSTSEIFIRIVFFPYKFVYKTN